MALRTPLSRLRPLALAALLAAPLLAGCVTEALAAPGFTARDAHALALPEARAWAADAALVGLATAEGVPRTPAGADGEAAEEGSGARHAPSQGPPMRSSRPGVRLLDMDLPGTPRGALALPLWAAGHAEVEAAEPSSRVSPPPFDGRIGDGRAAVWLVGFHSPSKGKVLLVETHANGTVSADEQDHFDGGGQAAEPADAAAEDVPAQVQGWRVDSDRAADLFLAHEEARAVLDAPDAVFVMGLADGSVWGPQGQGGAEPGDDATAGDGGEPSLLEGTVWGVTAISSQADRVATAWIDAQVGNVLHFEAQDFGDFLEAVIHESIGPVPRDVPLAGTLHSGDLFEMHVFHIGKAGVDGRWERTGTSRDLFTDDGRWELNGPDDRVVASGHLSDDSWPDMRFDQVGFHSFVVVWTSQVPRLPAGHELRNVHYDLVLSLSKAEA